MTNQRNETDDRDAALSRSYRQLSNETTPADLDARILGEAARAARPGYVRPIRWMRPLAWAATVVLTVSIIVHMAELPTPSDITAPALEPAAPIDESAADRLDATADSTAAPEREAEPVRDAVVPDEAAMATAAAERRERAAAVGTSADTTTAKTAESFDAAARSQPDNDMLRRASELAREQESGSEAAPVVAEMALRQMAEEPPASTCSDDERHAGDTWFACIERLRAAGQDEAAAAELADLIEAFPAFEIP